MTSTSTPELLRLTYEPARQLLVGSWGYQPSQPELAPAYERLRGVALKCRARRWLQDIRLRTLPDPYTTQWLFDEFYPDLSQQLGGQLRVAYLVAPRLRGLIEAGPDFQPLAWYTGKPFTVNFFGDEATAIAWLLEE
jgi:hypothetical protein